MHIDSADGSLEVTVGGPDVDTTPTICAAHPAGTFKEPVVELLSWTANTRVVCVNPRGMGTSSVVKAGQRTYTLEQMVDDIEGVRRQLGIGKWIFWGMSGGGWLGQIYAYRHAGALSGLLLESVCACFRFRLADPDCVLSPFHPPWRSALEHRGLISDESHAQVGDPSATDWIDVEGVGAVFRRHHGPALLVSPMPVTAEMRAAMPVLWTVDNRALLSEVRTPTLVICGTADPVVPVRHAQAVQQGIASSELFLVEGGGHVPVTEKRPEVVERVRGFLGSLSVSVGD